MINYNDLIGLPVYIKSSNEKIAVIKDILFDIHNKTILGLIIQKKNIIKLPKYIPLEEIITIESTSITIKSVDSIKVINDNTNLHKMMLQLDSHSLNSQVYSKDGQKVGKVNDIMFNFEIGEIGGFIISNGVIEDIISGRKIIDNNQIKFKENKIYLK